MACDQAGRIRGFPVAGAAETRFPEAKFPRMPQASVRPAGFLAGGF